MMMMLGGHAKRRNMLPGTTSRTPPVLLSRTPWGENHSLLGNPLLWKEKSNFENTQPSSCSLSELGSRLEMEKLFPMLLTKSEVSAANLQLISSEFWKASKACNASVMSSTTSQRHKNLEFAANLLPPSLRTIAMPTTKLWNIAISCTRASSSFCRICGKLQINRPKNLSRNFWEKHLQVLRK